MSVTDEPDTSSRYSGRSLLKRAGAGGGAAMLGGVTALACLTLPAGAAGRANAKTPTLSIGNASASQPDAGTVDAVLTVRLSHATAKKVTVRYRTQDVDATAGTDYIAAAGKLVFKPRQRSAHIVVKVLGGIAPEDDETFSVVLSGAHNARIGRRSGIVSIPFNHLPAPFTARATLTSKVSATAYGSIVISCDPVSGQVSYTISVSGLPADPIAVHIHHDFNDPTLFLRPMPPANGTASGTVNARRAILISLYEKPGEWNAVVHEDPSHETYELAGYFSRP